ncbi:MAG: YqjF family protein [Polyangia bacterium]
MGTDRWPVGHQDWRDLLFVHQPVPVELLRRLVPLPLTIDTFDGQGWATLIPFAIQGSRPAGAPAALGMSFLETNLRTYVRSPGGEAGIFFFSLEASSWLAVAGARAAYALPYFPARMECRKDGNAFQYRSVRRLGGAGAELEVTWEVGTFMGPAAPGRLDHFLVERYVLFAQRGDQILRARVRHQPYPLCAATVPSLRETLFAHAGLPALAHPPPLAHFSPGVDVDIFWRARI